MNAMPKHVAQDVHHREEIERERRHYVAETHLRQKKEKE
jgi:hypothetical protein